VDEQHTGDARAADEARLLLEVLTPIAKSWPSENCLEANSLAIQIHGGYGYTRDFPVEQYWRDNRLNMIHEGTHGIQAMDLLGRKVLMEGGRGLQLLAGRINATIERALQQPRWRHTPTRWPRPLRAWAVPPRPPGPPATRARRWPTPCPTCRPLATSSLRGRGWIWRSLLMLQKMKRTAQAWRALWPIFINTNCRRSTPGWVWWKAAT
jgi:hypothetical protein